MNRSAIAWTLAGLFVLTLPLAASARGGNRGASSRASNCVQAQTGAQNGTRQRLRDGSCGNPNCPNQGTGAMNRRGNGYGPGDGTGNQGARPQDGTGNGTPSGN